MSLEFHVYGPGFGETIFLRWSGGHDNWRGALVDAHSNRDGQWLADKLRELGLAELDFVVATHPHLDHIRNLAAGLKRSSIRVQRVLYWPPFNDSTWFRFYDRLAAQEGGHLSETAEMIHQWFGYLKTEEQANGLVTRGVEGLSDFSNTVSCQIQGAPLKITVIGPWNTINCRLCKNIANSSKRNRTIDYEHRYGNDVSIALLLEYGSAQVVLGGDMEETNWAALTREIGRPRFKPSFIKVSHHGSENGRIDGMWKQFAGFFGGKGMDAVAVVTPWRQAGCRLPNGDLVLDEIRKAGFLVYVTAQGEHGYCNEDSHVSVLVYPDGATIVTDHSPDVRKVWPTRMATM